VEKDYNVEGSFTIIQWARKEKRKFPKSALTSMINNVKTVNVTKLKFLSSIKKGKNFTFPKNG